MDASQFSNEPEVAAFIKTVTALSAADSPLFWSSILKSNRVTFHVKAIY